MRLTIFAKGNLDVRDTLHSLRLGGVVVWNGVNEVLRETHPGWTARIRHEPFSRSDALLAARGDAPAELSARLDFLGVHTPACQFGAAFYEPGADAYVLSTQPDLTTRLFRHRRDGYRIHVDPSVTDAEHVAWLKAEFIREPLLSADECMANLAAIVARLRERTAAPVLIYNLSAAVPGERVHAYEGLEETFATRIRRFNLGLVELSARCGVSIIDVDRLVAEGGAERLKLDTLHLTEEGCRRVAAEVVRVLDDLGAFAREGAG